MFELIFEGVRPEMCHERGFNPYSFYDCRHSCSNSFSEGFDLESAVSADSLVDDFGILEEFKREKMEKRKALGFGDCCPEVTPSIFGFR